MKILGYIIVIKRSGADGTPYPLTSANPNCAVGRGIECDIRVQLPVVSLQHCRIEVEQSGKAYLTNISASSPTHLNKQQLCPEEIQMLCHGDVIYIADRQLRWEYPEESLLATTTRRDKDVYKILTPHAKAPVCYQNDDQFNGAGNYFNTDPRKKKVSFGKDLLPEHFDKLLPPSTPVRKGEKPDDKTDLFVSPLTLGIGKKNNRASATPSASVIVEEPGLETPTKSLLRRRSPTPVKPYLARSLGLLTPKLSPETDSSKIEANGISNAQTPKAIVDNQSREINATRRLSDLSPKSDAVITDLSISKITETPNTSTKPAVAAKKMTPTTIPNALGSKISKSSTPNAQTASNPNSSPTKKSGSSRKASPMSSPKEVTCMTEADHSDARQSRSTTPKSQKPPSEKTSRRLSQKDSVAAAFEGSTPKLLRSLSPRAARIRSRSQSPVPSASRNSSPKSPSNSSPNTLRELGPSKQQSPRTPRESSPKTPVTIKPRISATKTSLNGLNNNTDPITHRVSSPGQDAYVKDSPSSNNLDEIPKVLRSSSPRTAHWVRSQSPVPPRDHSPKTSRSSSPKTPKEDKSKTPVLKTPKNIEHKTSRSPSPRTPRVSNLTNSNTPTTNDQKDTTSKAPRDMSPSNAKTPRVLSPSKDASVKDSLSSNNLDEIPKVLRSSSPRTACWVRSQSPVPPRDHSPKTSRSSSPKTPKEDKSKTPVLKTPKNIEHKASRSPSPRTPRASNLTNSNTPTTNDKKDTTSKSLSPKTPRDMSPSNTSADVMSRILRSSSPRDLRRMRSHSPVSGSPKAQEHSSPKASVDFTPKPVGIMRSETPQNSSPVKTAIINTGSSEAIKDSSPTLSKDASSKKMKIHVKNTNRRASLALQLGQSPRKSLKPRRSLSSQVLRNIVKNVKPRTPKMSTYKTPEKQDIFVATPGSVEPSPMVLEINDLDVSNIDKTSTPSIKYVQSDILQLIGTNRTSPRKQELGKRSSPLRISSPSKTAKTLKRSVSSTHLEKESGTTKTPATVGANLLDTPKRNGSEKQTRKSAKKLLPEIKVTSPDTNTESLSKRTPKPTYGQKRKASMSPESPIRKKIKTGTKTPSTGSKSLFTKKLSVRKQALCKSTPKKSWADVLKRGLMAHGVPAAKAKQVSIVMHKARIARQNKKPENERTPPTFSTEIPSNFNFGKSTGHVNSPASIFIHKKTSAKTPKLYRRGRKLPVIAGQEKGSIDNLELEGLAELLNTPESKERNFVQKTTGWTLPDIVNHFTPLSKVVRLRQMYDKNKLTPSKGNETPGGRSDVSSVSTVTPSRNDSVNYSPSQFSPVTPPDGNTSIAASSFANTPASHMNYTDFDFSSVKTPDVTEEIFVSPMIPQDQSNKTPERLLRCCQKSLVVSLVPLETDTTTFDFAGAKTPKVSRDMLVSPMSTKSKRFSPRTQANMQVETPNSPRVTRQNNSVLSSPNVDDTVMSTSPFATSNSGDAESLSNNSSTVHTPDYTDVRGMKRLLRTPKAERESPTPDYTNVEGMKKLLKTPKSSEADHKADYTDVIGMKRLLRTPKAAVESPEANMAGIKKLLKTPRPAPVEHEADYTNVAGVKKLLNTPRLLDTVPDADYTDVAGMKNLLKTPKATDSGYTNVRGIRNLLKTPKAAHETPKADYTNVVYMRKLLATPRTEVFETEADYTNVAGIKKLLKTPHREERERNPVNDYTNVHGLKKLLKTPNRSNEVIADYTDPKGLKKLMATPRQRSSEPLSDYTNVAGVKKLMRTPHSAAKSPKADYTQVDGIRNLMKTPKAAFQHIDIDFEGVSQLLKSPIVKNATVIEQIVDLVKDATTPTSLRKSSRTKKAVSPAGSSPSENVPPEEDLKMIVDLIRNEDLKGVVSPRRSRRNVKASPVVDDTPKKARGARKTALTISTPDVAVESTENNTPTTRNTRGKRKAAYGEISTQVKKTKKGEDPADAQLETTESVNDAADLIASKEAVESKVLTEKVENPVVEDVATPKTRGREKKNVQFDLPTSQEVTPSSSTRARRNQKAKENVDATVETESKAVKEELANGSESKAGTGRRGRGKKHLETETEKESVEGISLKTECHDIPKQTRKTRRGKSTQKKLPEEIGDMVTLEINQEPVEEVKTDKKEHSHAEQKVTIDVQPTRTRRGCGRQVVNDLVESGKVTAENASPVVRRGRTRKANSETLELISPPVTKSPKVEVDTALDNQAVAEKSSPAVRKGRTRKTKDTTTKSKEETISLSTNSTNTKKDVEETRENKAKASTRSRRGQKRQVSEEREVTETQPKEDSVEKASNKCAKAQKSEEEEEKQKIEQPARRTRGKKNEIDAKDEDIPVTRSRRGNKKETKVVAESSPALPEKTTRRTRARK